MNEITTQQAQSAINIAKEKAAEINAVICIAVLDSSRDLLAFMRMDDALLGSIEISQAKAYTARTVNMKTADIGPLAQPGGPLYGFEVTHQKPLVLFGGGNPVLRNGKVIGAVGISGGTVEEDMIIADAVTAELERM